MTTLTTSCARSALSQAAGPAGALRELLKSPGAAGANFATAATDLTALASALETAALTHGPFASSGAAATLAFNTTGSNDATTKVAILAWVAGGVNAPLNGLSYSTAPGNVAYVSAPLATALIALGT